MSKTKKNNDEIEISPKHGVNPALDVCFWCGEPRGVVLMGRLRGKSDDDIEAPRKMVTSLDPCDACKKKLAKGIHLVEVSPDGSRFGNDERMCLHGHNGTPMWPTGRWAVVKPGAIKKGQAGDLMLCDKAVMDMVLGAQIRGNSGEGRQ